MANLLASLINSSGALNAYQEVLGVTQNNVSNASTPGYVKQRLLLTPLPFDPSLGSTGGVRSGAIRSARDEYSEQAVRRQTLSLGESQQEVNSLTSLQSLFDVSGKTGLPTALNNLFQSFSAWAQSPTDTVARQTMLDRATDVAGAFNQTATGLSSVAQDSESQLRQTVDQVNYLVGKLRGFNAQIMAGGKNDPALDAQVHSNLEELSQYADVTAIQQGDGSMSLLLNGETPLLLEDRQYKIDYKLVQPDTPPPTYPTARPLAVIVGSDGRDITAKTTGGQLGALVNFRNNVVPSYIGSAYQSGDLNDMAKAFAQRVNQLLTPTTTDVDGNIVQTGVPLFTFDTTNDTNVAQSLAVDPSVTPSQLTAITPGPPEVSNGVPLALAKLASPTDNFDKVKGASYNAFYGAMASRVGNALNQATDEQKVSESLVAQAKNLRQQSSGVSLDEEATVLIQFQRAYEANSRLITVLDQLTQVTINILQP